MPDFVEDHLKGVIQCLNEINKSEIEGVVDAIFKAYKKHRRVFTFGNGGSASTASHLACDLAKSTVVPGKARLAVMSLTDNVPMLTALANDINYASVFREQLANLLSEGDVALAISASGNSPNVIEAIEYAKSSGAVTIGICGFGGGNLGRLAEKSLVFSARDYSQVEDAHMVLAHLISVGVRQRIENEGR